MTVRTGGKGNVHLALPLPQRLNFALTILREKMPSQRGSRPGAASTLSAKGKGWTHGTPIQIKLK